MSNTTWRGSRLAVTGRALGLVALCVAVTACGVTGRLGKRVDDTWAGDLLFKGDDKLVLTTDAGNGLNPDARGTPLSVVVRVYQLSALERFARADPDTLWDNPRQALGNTVLDTQELVLVPGLGQVNRWPLAPAAGFVGVAAFFRDTVHDSHWKAAFAADAWRKDGIWFSTNGSRVLVDNNQILAVGGGDLLRQATTPEQLRAANSMPPSTTQTLPHAVVDASQEAAKASINSKAPSWVEPVHE